MALRLLASVALLKALMPGVSADCSCKFQGEMLPEELIEQYPTSQPGKYSTMVADGFYGTMCAAWDSVPGTPYMGEYCNASVAGTDFAGNESWCNAPWCYVDESCDSKIASSVFSGSTTAFYSYATCGAPDCFSSVSNTGCPYGTVHDDDCECIYHGETLDAELVLNYPSQQPGKYANLDGISIYGTTCAAWDQMPGTPWISYCPAGSDWCDSDFNWCQAPWCYVSDACSTKVASSVFNGSTTAFYSYNTCANTPDCYGTFATDVCPFNGSSNNWYTAVGNCTMSSSSNPSTTTTTVSSTTKSTNEGSKAVSALALSSITTVSVIMAIAA